MGDAESDSVPQGQWSVADIVYITLVSPLMLAAFLEWFLWLAAFLFGLVNVCRKADHWSTRVIAVLMMLLFSVLRAIFLPVMVVTLPLPLVITRHFPWPMVYFLQWFAFYTFSIILLVPWVLCMYRLVTNEIGRSNRVKEVLHESNTPKVVVVMPVYNEEPGVLIKAIDSVVGSDYPSSCLHVFLSFDGEPTERLWKLVATQLGIPVSAKKKNQSIDVIYNSVRVTVSRFPHGGKRHCQKRTFRLIDRIYVDYLAYNDDLFILFIDSDCILDKVCIQNFMYDMELKPGSGHDMLAMTGIITSTTQSTSLITILQDMEYIHGQLFERSVESTCGAVTCLPGALTMLRFSAFRKMAKYYFEDQIDRIDDFFDYIKCHLGEDRWLTHLFMVSTVKRYQIQLCTGAFCKTEAVQTMSSLIKQRRRWFLGFISNEVLSTTSSSLVILPLGFIAISLGLNYALMLYFGYILHRFKAWLYPLMFLLNPFFNWLYLVYGCCTAGKRTWGGPRTNAPKADEHTSPREAAEQAEAQGDDLNVDVSTFREYGHAAIGVPLHPTESAANRLVNNNQDELYGTHHDSELALVHHNAGDPTVPRIPLHPRNSFDSAMTETYSIQLPLRVESLMDEEEMRNFYPSRETKLMPEKDKDEEKGTTQSSPTLPGRLHLDGETSVSASTETNMDSVKQLAPLHLTRSPLGLHNTVPEEEDPENTARMPLFGGTGRRSTRKSDKKRRHLFTLGRRSGDQ
ncbi:Chitin synthase D [Talaromyces atroroseus]|uniref:chitin synthase n=1 Tax=Talaromyces atroroseus TaxID=1441469 RepID=A0A225BAG4_TALAT|nr:Chitin synthase D [Talaromyces atroroseus]OKL64376.1 Chitin synthase D [Talaromyces atroroseus]